MSLKKVAILQSSYIPWKGYFNIIAQVDEFILFDDAQFTKNDWRNRNKIKTPQGAAWLTIPVGQNINRRIRDVTLNSKWQQGHWKSLESNYRRCKFFEEISFWLRPMYLDRTYTYLSEVNRCFIEAICHYLDIETQISNSWDYTLSAGKTERVADLCLAAGGHEYFSGPSAKDYIDESVFVERGIKLNWIDYKGYPEYPQLWGQFVHHVSILDLLFNCGTEACDYMKNTCKAS